MRLVVATEPGVVELNWTWLPTWLGMNHAVKVEVEKELAPLFVGLPITDKNLDDMSDAVLEYLCAKHAGIPGLRQVLQAVKNVEVPG